MSGEKTVKTFSMIFTVATDGSEAMALRADSSQFITQSSGALAHTMFGNSFLGYADENSLRSLIAEPRIIALGLVSRSDADEAVKSSSAQCAATHQWKAVLTPGHEDRRFAIALHFAKSRLIHALTYWKGRSLVYRAVQVTFATAVLVLYSRNMVSAAIRAVLGV